MSTPSPSIHAAPPLWGSLAYRISEAALVGDEDLLVSFSGQQLLDTLGELCKLADTARYENLLRTLLATPVSCV
jgi:hypothetical protein